MNLFQSVISSIENKYFSSVLSIFVLFKRENIALGLNFFSSSKTFLKICLISSFFEIKKSQIAQAHCHFSPFCKS